MPLLGSAAMLLSFDIAPEAVDEHDRWHSQEHLPERLSIPGFQRGTRWVADQGAPRYMVLYEVQDLGVLSAPAYLERLNHPTPWTTRTMPHYRGMRRGLCNVVCSAGLGHGGVAALVRFSAPPPHAAAIDAWLAQEVQRVVRLPGLCGAHGLRGAATASMTNEQRIRGADEDMDSAIVLTGCEPGAVAACAAQLAGIEGLPARGAQDIAVAVYRLAHSLTSADALA